MFGIYQPLRTLCASIVLLVSIACTGQAAAQAWTQLASTGGPPAGRDGHTAVFNTNHNRMVVFGGIGTSAFNDVWVLTNADGTGGPSVWTQLGPTGGPTPTRYLHSAVYDAANNRMIVFAGFAGGSSCSNVANDVWVLSNADGTGGPPVWTQLSPTGGPTPLREFQSAVYDAATNRMIIFGGKTGLCQTRDNNVWILTNANGLGGTPAWIQLAPSGTAPTGRTGPQAIYNAASNRMVIFGGFDNTLLTLNDTWVLLDANGLGSPAWIQLSPTGGPPPKRTADRSVYDPATNRMIVFGGGADSGYSVVFNDLWVLSNADGTGGTPNWTQINPTGILPSARTLSSAIYNAANNRMVVFQGCNTGCGIDFNDTWVLAAANGVNFPVTIDIKAGVTPNIIRLATDRDITVAILSTSTFNAPASVDRASLSFGHTGNEASLTSCNTASRDVDGDSRMDLVCHFSVLLEGFQLGDGLGYLRGLTLEGNAINGSDTVIVK